MSFLDVLFISENSGFNASRELFDFVMWDVLSYLNTTFFFSQALYYTDYQDFFNVLIYHSPELILAMSEFNTSYWFNSALHAVPSSTFDTFTDSINSVFDELLKYLFVFVMFIWVFIFVLGDTRVQSMFQVLNPLILRLELYFFTWSREMRMQFEAAIIIFFFFYLYVTMMILTFDDDQEEFLEYFEHFLFTGVFYVFIYYVIRVGVHFFSFLEASVSEGRTFSFVLSQFRRDAVNTFAFLMRLFTLMVRFFIYETNDDILDSYYIFIGDFDDDEYLNELFFSPASIIFFDSDNNDDRSLFFEDEFDMAIDLFSFYLVILAKLGSLMFYVPEGIARTFLALYIGYLIVFEVHTANRSYTEDIYITHKRTAIPLSCFVFRRY